MQHDLWEWRCRLALDLDDAEDPMEETAEEAPDHSPAEGYLQAEDVPVPMDDDDLMAPEQQVPGWRSARRQI